MAILTVEDISYSYKSKHQTVQALRQVSCEIEKGKFYAIKGASGSGKSTLLSLMAGLDVPDEGDIVVEGKSTKEINRDEYRQKKASVVYKAINLFPLLTVAENVAFPMLLNGVPKKEANKKAAAYLADMGLTERMLRHFPTMLSGGEQQRVAIARALAAGGEIILADEPTGNLDSENGETVVEKLMELAHKQRYAVVVVTHDESIAQKADVVYTMKDGKIVG